MEDGHVATLPPPGADATYNFRRYVRVAVAALRDLGRIMPSDNRACPSDATVEQAPQSSVPLSTLAFFADALLEQIDQAISQSTRRPLLSGRADAILQRVATDELTKCVERHLAEHLARPTDLTVTPSERIRRFIDAHYVEPLTLHTIAARVGCSRSYVAAAFKRQIGETPHRYVASVRVQRAAELIVCGAKIEAAIMMVGYRSKKNFYRQFKKRTGFTPGEYRAHVCSSPGRSGSVHEKEPPYSDTDGAGPGAIPVNAQPDATSSRPTGGAMLLRAIPERQRLGPSVTIPRAAELLRVSRRTVYYWIQKGRLTALRLTHGGRRILISSFPSAHVADRGERPFQSELSHFTNRRNKSKGPT